MRTAFEPDYATDTGPTLIFADSATGAQPYADGVMAAGGRIGGILRCDQIFDRLDQQSRARLLIVDVTNAPHVSIGRIVSRVEQFAAETATSALLAVPISALDEAMGASHSQHTTLLCDPNVADKLGAVSVALLERDLRMNDSATDLDSIRLKRLADEVHRIARALNGLSSVGDGEMGPARGLTGAVSDMLPGFSAQPADLIGFGAPDAEAVRHVLRLRRLRDRFFDSELFADPAWDILLDLLAARIEGDQVAVSSLCIAAAVPPTTALRWIKTMTDVGLLERHADPMDGRRIFIRLTEKAADAMARYFTAARRMGGLMI